MKTPKNHINSKLLLAFLLLAFFSCDNREWNNPFDPDCPKELFTPAGFISEQEGNLVKLTWTQSNTQISGFAIERSIDGGTTWSSVATPSKSELNWSDNNITAGKEHKYRLVAKAGSNISNEVTAQVTPVFASTLTTKPLTKLLSTSAVLGGEITSDGGTPVTARGVCWNTSPNPTISNSKTTDGTGTGIFTSLITGLSTVTTYYARAYSTTSVGTSYGNEISFKTYFGEVTDIDGNIYPTVKIGEQVWMAENLKVTKYNDGTAIPNVTDNTVWAALTTGAYCWYNNDATTYKATYGALYNWYAVNTNKLAPTGWHVPIDEEWTTLTNYLGGVDVAGGKLKEVGTTHWQSPNTGATNETSFTALPGGYRDNNYTDIKNISGFWSSTIYPQWNAALDRIFIYSITSVYIGNPRSRANGLSVRCVLGTLSSPTVSTTAITNKTTNSASSGGNITSDGGAAISARGVCWSTTPNPTTANSKTTNGTGSGSFTSNITGLTANTTYYVRAYATNSQGTAYGAQESFTTSQSVSMATVTTTAVTTFTTTTAVLGGNVTSDGNATVTERGVVYATTQNPTTSNTKVTMGTGTGIFSNTVTGLTANTTYYIRAYAINSQGTSYGSEVSFKTNPILAMATVTTTAVTTFTTTNAVLGGNVTSDGNATVTERGVVYATTQNPTTSNTKVTMGTGTGSFSNTVTGLTANTTYYVRSYAINSQGTSYGSEVSFKTNPTLALATVTTTAVTIFTTTTALLGGNVTSDGNATVTERGVVYATTSNPTTTNTKVTIGTGTGSFSNTVSGLTANTTYYVRAYAINSQGTAYGSEVSFKTNPILALATVTTTAVTTFTTTTAVLGGNVTNDGNATITERGVVYATTQNPTTVNTKVAMGTGIGIFSNNITGLATNTTYYVRSYATNSMGTAYGDEVSFINHMNTPEPSVTDIDGNTYRSVRIGNQIWMAENLKSTKYYDGTNIPNVTDNVAWANLKTPGYCWYNNDINNKAIYGALYNWFTVNTGKLCPIGWHVPTDIEWTKLSDYLGGENVAGGKMKTTSGWYNNGNGTNSSGFSALPGGNRGNSGDFGDVGIFDVWWSSTEYSVGSAWYRYLYYGDGRVYRNDDPEDRGFSVRCVRD
jgi:uncharacterized protein (TIGR02145 family)